jgi:hypothetical protein
MKDMKSSRIHILKFLSDVKIGKEKVQDIHGLGVKGFDLFNRTASDLTADEFKAQLDYLEEKFLIERKPSRMPPAATKEGELKLGFYKITADGIDMIEDGNEHPSKEISGVYQNDLKGTQNDLKGTELDIFISHSSADKTFVEKLIALLRSSLNISPQRIRCSSVDGFRLSIGVNIEEQLRKEVYDAEILIGVITPSSMKSAYVLFELGARWGAKKKMFPVLACGADPSILGGPLKAVNSLDCTSVSQIHQLIDEISNTLQVSKESPALYQNQVDELIKLNAEMKTPSTSQNGHNSLIFEDGVYWKQNGDKRDGPFCQLCWDRDHRLLRLAQEKVDDGEKTVNHRFCRSCNSNY